MIKIGRIVGIFGVKGEMKLISETDNSKRFLAGSWITLNNGEKLEIISSRIKKNNLFILKFRGFDSIEKSTRLIGFNAVISDEELPELEEDQYYTHDIVNCKVYSKDNHYIGRVINYIELPANDAIEILHKKESVIFPFIDNFIIEIDKKNKKVIIDSFEDFL